MSKTGGTHWPLPVDERTAMTLHSARAELSLSGNPADLGRDIYDLAAEIFPICRSLTGPGVRRTLRVLSRAVPLERRSIASGERVYDWTVPREWLIRDAYIKDPAGRKIVDFARSNLHVVGYSMPIQRFISLEELLKHVHTLPNQPEVIPYRTSYYSPDWGFCMAHSQLVTLPEGRYEVFIDSELRDGQLDFGEFVHRGRTDREFLFTAHICHPSLANDNCSGLALLAILARELSKRETRFTYRFLFAPATIGALTWLSRNEDLIPRIDHGLVVSCVGDEGGPTYKRSRRGNAFIDRVMSYLLTHREGRATVKDFAPYGYDERQFCSPGFDMPVGLLQSSAFGTFPEYHTSADDLSFIRPEYLGRSYRIIMDAIEIVEKEWVPVNLQPKGEPQLGRRRLYSAMGGHKSAGDMMMAILWVLNLADGTSGLLDISERAKLPYSIIAEAADLLRQHNLLAPASVDNLRRLSG